MAKRNKYADYRPETQAFLNAVEKHLINNFKEIKPHWNAILNMLATQYDIFFECRERIKKDGIMVRNRFGTIDKNPLLKVQNDAQIQIVKLVEQFGLSPKAIKNLPTEEDSPDDFISAMVG